VRLSTLGKIGLPADAVLFDRIVDAYDTLAPCPEAEEALGLLAKYRLAILSNGSPDMLDALVRNSALDRYLEAVIGVDAKRAYKPDPRAYELIQERLGVWPREVRLRLLQRLRRGGCAQLRLHGGADRAGGSGGPARGTGKRHPDQAGGDVPRPADADGGQGSAPHASV